VEFFDIDSLVSQSAGNLMNDPRSVLADNFQPGKALGLRAGWS